MDTLKDNSPGNFQSEKREVLLLAVILTILATFFLLLFNKTDMAPVVNIASLVGYELFILWWCRIDSAERKSELSLALSIFLIAFGLIALIYYFFSTRGLRGGLIALAYSLLLLFGLSLIQILVMAIYSIFFTIEI